jgi:hypothetical protein
MVAIPNGNVSGYSGWGMPTLDYSDISSPLDRDHDFPASTTIKEVKRSSSPMPRFYTRKQATVTSDPTTTTSPQHHSVAEFIEMADGLE